jgi:hypothetical protein
MNRLFYIITNTDAVLTGGVVRLPSARIRGDGD